MPKIKQGMSLKKVNWEIITNDPVWAGMNARRWSNLTDDGDEQYVIGFQSAEDANSFEAEFAS
ncbi:hypothetical protein [Brevundimonas sp.]|uniref:hypothetical protein n=1 Tax=Brevundimonas sp. TaxID=1871086 RepID=UPI00289A4BF5|nr:hypothetical protein [Brevundimonas sp.]